MQGFLDAQSAQQCRSIVFGGISSQVGKLLFEFGHEESVFVREVFLGIECIALTCHVPQHGVALQHGVEHRLGVKFVVVLREHREAFAGSHLHRTFGRLKFAADGSQQGGFACTVCTDDAIDVATGKLHVNILIKDTLAKLNGEILY